LTHFRGQYLYFSFSHLTSEEQSNWCPLSIKIEGLAINLDDVMTRKISVASGNVTQTYWSEPCDWLLASCYSLEKIVRITYMKEQIALINLQKTL